MSNLPRFPGPSGPGPIEAYKAPVRMTAAGDVQG